MPLRTRNGGCLSCETQRIEVLFLLVRISGKPTMKWSVECFQTTFIATPLQQMLDASHRVLVDAFAREIRLDVTVALSKNSRLHAELVSKSDYAVTKVVFTPAILTGFHIVVNFPLATTHQSRMVELHHVCIQEKE
eukprot:5924833-Amphidinium_carterae.1